MKKIALTLAIVLGFGLTTYAAPNGGGLFQRGVSDEEYYGTGYYSQYRESQGMLPTIPNHGSDNNQDAPLGSGIVLLSVLGGAYLVSKKRREE